MTSKLKFAGFQVGQRIRAYDFKPRPEIRDRYIEGEILAVNEQGDTEASWAHYVVRVDVDTAFAVGQDRVGTLTYVPLETTFDWDCRVVPADTKSGGQVMTTTTHTPGPWAAAINYTNAVPLYAVIDHAEMYVTVNGDNIEANAALIAAAPDLLAALKGFFDADVAADIAVSRSTEKAFNRARAAIAKAEGK